MYDGARSMYHAIFPITTASTSCLDGCDYAAGCLLNGYHYKSLTLHWCSHLSSPKRHTNSNWGLNNCTKIAYRLYWQPVYRFYVLSFESKIFETSQFLSHHYTHHFHNEWCSCSAFQRYRPAIYGITIHALVLDTYSLTSSPFLTQLVCLISMTHPKQLSNSRPSAGGLSEKICCWLDGLTKLIGCHLSQFPMCLDRTFYESYDITDLNCVSKFRLKFRCCFISYP
jgi:hypothetical protein